MGYKFRPLSFSYLKDEPIPRSKSAPKSPKGDFHKVLTFSVSPPRRIRDQNDKNQQFVTFRSGIKDQCQKAAIFYKLVPFLSSFHIRFPGLLITYFKKTYLNSVTFCLFLDRELDEQNKCSLNVHLPHQTTFK
jgi:hypothetical protein